MRLLSGILRGRSLWLIRRNDPLVMPLGCDGWGVLNPVALDNQSCIPITADVVLVGSHSITLVVPESHVASGEDPSFIERLLCTIRAKARQSSLGVRIAGYGYVEKDSFSIQFPDHKLFPGMKVRSTMVQQAISSKILAEIDVLNLFDVPVHESILLDAIEAAHSADWAKAILFAAIGIEAMARRTLEATIEDHLLRTPPAQHVRSVAISLAGGSSCVKDPIYECLSERTSFRTLLHELPLYVMQRSLMLDHDELYRNALRIFARRNKLAHHADEMASEDAIPVSPSGAWTAIESACAIFKWFGVDGEFLPEDRFLKSSELLSLLDRMA